MNSAYYRQPLTADQLWRNGLDSMDIAKYLGITEAEALRQVTIQRSERLTFRAPYDPRFDATRERHNSREWRL